MSGTTLPHIPGIGRWPSRQAKRYSVCRNSIVRWNAAYANYLYHLT